MTLQLSCSAFYLEIDECTGGIRTFRNANDSLGTNFALDPTSVSDFDGRNSRWLGDVVLYARSTKFGKRMYSSLSRDILKVQAVSSSRALVAFAGDAADPGGFSGVEVVVSYEIQDDRLVWSTKITNALEEDIEIEDLGFPLMMNSFWADNQRGIYEDCVSRHSFTALDGSYIYWQRPNGVGPYLLMVPDRGTHLEFKNKFRENEGPYGALGAKWEGLAEYYVHSAKISEERLQQSGSYLPATSFCLARKESRTVSFSFAWAESYAHMRDVLFGLGSLDVISLPGMVVPMDTRVTLAVRAKGGITSVCGEQDTSARRCPARNGYDIFEISFSDIGAKNVTVTYADSHRSVLQYCSIEPIEKLIDRRAAFLTANQQAKTPRGYNGAFLQWDMVTKSLITWENCPEVEGCWKEWMAGGSDDLGLAPAAFLSQKTLLRPDQVEIDSIDYYMTHFLLGYLQNVVKDGERTYQVYRWYDGQDRVPFDTGVWRSYNYVHIANTYLNMYHASKAFRHFTFAFRPSEYLDFCCQTLIAMFTKIPMPTPIGDAAKEMGHMGESTYPEILKALEEEGMTAQRVELEKHIRNKYNVFRSELYPFASEQTIDTTGFEATYTLGKLFKDTSLARKTQNASLACRGLQPAWYHYGSDNRLMGESWWNLGYETQLGAWQQQDYLVTFARQGSVDFADQMRSTHGAYLAGWANVNSGQIDVDPLNIGAAAWLYQSEKGENEWPWMGIKDGWWMWSGEADLGFWGALRTGAVNIVEDPIIGLYAYSGELARDGTWLSVIPRDGIRNQLNLFNVGNISIKLRYSRYTSAAINTATRECRMCLEDLTRGQSSIVLSLRIMSEEEFEVSLSGTEWKTIARGGREIALLLPPLSGPSPSLRIVPFKNC